MKTDLVVAGYKLNENELKSFAWLSKDELDKNHIPADVRAMALKGF